MTHEIEAKIKVAALEPIAEKLKAIGADFHSSIQQTDTYFADASGQLLASGCALRIRRQVIDAIPSALITYKGPRNDGRFKNRPEYETVVGSAEIAEKIFESLNLHEKITVEKNRDMWLLGECEVCLDALPQLGCFVEVEGPGEAAICTTLEKLGLQNEPHISASYASMKAEYEGRKTP